MAWHLLKRGDDHAENSNYMEFLIDSASDVSSPTTEYSYAMGSIAHTPGYTHIYEAAADGTWVEISN